MPASAHFMEPIPINHIHFAGRSFSILRDDLSHPHYGGNKWRKLKYNLERARHEGHDTILTYGGAWSNHIYATAMACREHGFRSIGVIRGEEPEKYSDTLEDARDAGMQFFFVSRAEYREKEEPFFKAWLRTELGRFYQVPEGGSNFLGVQGCTEILDERCRDFELICCASGTGATATGIALSLQDHQRLRVYSALKGIDVREQMKMHLLYALGDEEAADEVLQQVEVAADSSLGGYAKTTPGLIEFIRQFHGDTGVMLDAVYTGKMVYAMSKEAAGESALIVHTGGQQGNRGVGI